LLLLLLLLLLQPQLTLELMLELKLKLQAKTANTMPTALLSSISISRFKVAWPKRRPAGRRASTQMDPRIRSLFRFSHLAAGETNANQPLAWLGGRQLPTANCRLASAQLRLSRCQHL